MDKAQMDTLLGDIPKNNQEQSRKDAEYGYSHQEDTQDVHLSDILKPATLISGVVVLVLLVLYGWYVYVLAPALHDNESMIHFMPSSQVQAKSEAPAVTSTVTREKPQENAIPANAEQHTELSPQIPATPAPAATTPVNNDVISTPAETNRLSEVNPVKKHHLKRHRANKHAPDSVVAQSQQHPTLNEEPKCTQAQITLHQCASYQ